MAATDLHPGGFEAASRPHPELTFELIPVQGMQVRVAHRTGPLDRTRGTAIILTGRAEFVEKYDETLTELGQAGFSVAIFDWRGQGGSERFAGLPRSGHVMQIEDYLTDLDTVLDHFERRRLPRPWLMIGHSMGGHVGLRYLAEGPRRFAAAMLTAPMFGIDLRPLPDAVARAICAFAIRVGAGQRYAPGQRDFDPARMAYPRNKFTTCETRFADFLRRVETTPDLIIGGVTYHWLAASLRSIAIVRQPGYVERIDLPVLVCQAGDERVVCNRSIVAIARRLRQGRLLVIPEGRHELLRERDPVRRQVLDAFESFVQEVAPGS